MATSVVLKTSTDSTPAATQSTAADRAEDADEEAESDPENSELAQRFADWSSVTAALREKLTTAALDKTFE